LKILCPGTTIPTQIQDIVVPITHQSLVLSLSGELPCTTDGSIRATVSFGFNSGGDGAEYQYAIWSSNEGNEGRPDSQLASLYSAPTTSKTTTFTNKAAGTYFVRVKDKCGNFVTRSIILTQQYPPVDLGVTTSWECNSNGSANLKVIGHLNTIPVLYRYGGYKFKVDDVSDAATTTPCDLKAGTPIITETIISDEASMTFSIPEG
jgi:hypothetical protein